MRRWNETMQSKAKRIEEAAFKVFIWGPTLSVLLFGIGGVNSVAGVDPEFDYPGTLGVIAFGIFIASILAGVVSAFSWLAQWSARFQEKS